MQGVIVIYGFLRNFTIAEKLASIVAVKGITWDSDLYTDLKDTLDKCELDFNNVLATSTDGTSSMLIQNWD